MINIETLKTIEKFQDSYAGKALTANQARLYSQRIRLEMGQKGLSSFTDREIYRFLDDAITLIHFGLFLKNSKNDSKWQYFIKRAAEILEWLSQQEMRPNNIPVQFLAAASYQLVGYPAMAQGLLKRMCGDDQISNLLLNLFRSDFHNALESVILYWNHYYSIKTVHTIVDGSITTQTYKHIIMCIGTICNYFRTGDEENINLALQKFNDLSRSLLYSKDSYSYYLATLTAACCEKYINTNFWPYITKIKEEKNVVLSKALDQFTHSAFENGRILVWPAQAKGINKLIENTSFVLCTPTGSGKTTVATLAIVQSLFSEKIPNEKTKDSQFFQHQSDTNPLVLYLVPTRALAAEVESRLSEDLKNITPKPIIVTGLYGGVDWGPTDAWIQSDSPTIIICTYEKADALIRYLGILFLERVRLVVIDEAHQVNQKNNSYSVKNDVATRSFRLEQLGSRLLNARDFYNFRIIALSAVAGFTSDALSRWLDNSPNPNPISSQFRSTRQMLGYIEVTQSGNYEIHYDFMNGHTLEFKNSQEEITPYVPTPFTPLPNGIDPNVGPEVKMRAPTFWAALNLAAEGPDGTKPSVMISLTQNIDNFASECADLIEKWASVDLPNYYVKNNDSAILERCLASASDYFSEDSVEYRLLKHGIVIHHGKMPALLARRLKVAIEKGIIRVIIATSTLSEGINIPVNYILIPSLYRATTLIDIQEFENLIGRAGRPGVATEGCSFIVVSHENKVSNRNWIGYNKLKQEFIKPNYNVITKKDNITSPLIILLNKIKYEWSQISKTDNIEYFEKWLEDINQEDIKKEDHILFDYLDTFDSFLLTALKEIEDFQKNSLSTDQIEKELKKIWRHTYAYSSIKEENFLERVFLARGRVILNKYPDSSLRKKIYDSSLTPKSAISLIDLTDDLTKVLKTGNSYSTWDVEQQFTYIRDVLSCIAKIPMFNIPSSFLNKKANLEWTDALRWWLSPKTAIIKPEVNKITAWYDFVATNFVYKSTWGLGSYFGLIFGKPVNGKEIKAIEIDDWPRTGLPWIAFWLKELLTWGTLDPVAAFLLAKGDAIDRKQAEKDSQKYYDHNYKKLKPNDMLDPRLIRKWVSDLVSLPQQEKVTKEKRFLVDLEKNKNKYKKSQYSVFAIDLNEKIGWIDPAGYLLATSNIQYKKCDNLNSYDNRLFIDNKVVLSNSFLKH